MLAPETAMFEAGLATPAIGAESWLLRYLAVLVVK